MNDFRVFFRVENRTDLLANALRSIPEFLRKTTVIDNTPTSHVYRDLLAQNIMVDEVYVPPVPLNFTQSHNLFFRMAGARGAKFILWMHGDAEAVDGGHLKLLEMARKITGEGRSWHTIWTNYDSLAAVNLDSINDAGGYDPALPKYFNDNDLHRRMKIAGWELVNSGIHTIHHGSQTIKSNQTWNYINSQTFDLYREYYIRKHGGPPGEEKFDHPFNQPWMSWKDAHPQA